MTCVYCSNVYQFHSITGFCFFLQQYVDTYKLLVLAFEETKRMVSVHFLFKKNNKKRSVYIKKTSVKVFTRYDKIA